MPSLSGLHHLELPVSHVERSRDRYLRDFDSRVELEFVKDGALLGVALRDERGRAPLSPRRDPDRAKALSRFDPIAIGVPSRDELDGWRRRLNELGERHDRIVLGRAARLIVGLRDPDDLEVRL